MKINIDSKARYTDAILTLASTRVSNQTVSENAGHRIHALVRKTRADERRESQHTCSTQERLCDGFCSPTLLSSVLVARKHLRIVVKENGESDDELGDAPPTCPIPLAQANWPPGCHPLSPG